MILRSSTTLIQYMMSNEWITLNKFLKEFMTFVSDEDLMFKESIVTPLKNPKASSFVPPTLRVGFFEGGYNLKWGFEVKICVI